MFLELKKLSFFVIAAASIQCTSVERTESSSGSAAAVDVDEALQMSLESLVEEELVAGAVGLAARDGEVAFRGAAGYADHEDNEEMTVDHLFRIASMSKPVTSVAIMILYDEGLLDLDDPLSKFLPSFAVAVVVSVDDDGIERELPAERDITVRHLLAHTSGLAYKFLAQDPLLRHYEEAGIVDGLVKTERDLEEQMARLSQVPLAHHPGDDWTYGLSTDVLGAVVEAVSGERLNVFFQERIFEPLGMDDTGFFVEKEDEARLTTVYRPDGAGGLEPIEGTVVEGPLEFSVDAPTESLPSYLSGGAGLVSTVDDYFRFCQMISNRGELDGVRILEPETVDLMMQNHIGDLAISFDESKFGLGFSITGRSETGIPEGVVGWGGFYGSEFWIDPETGIVAVFMSQVYNLPRRDEIVRRFGREVFRALTTPPSNEPS